MRRIIAKADVVVENYGPGVLEKRGLDYESLRAVNPKLVMASISAFGRRNSPLAHKVGFDTIAQAFSGFMHMTGERDGGALARQAADEPRHPVSKRTGWRPSEPNDK